MLQRTCLLVALCCASWSVWADTPVVDQREANQRERIASGVQSGELTRPEAHRLAHAERNLHRHEVKAKADGVVTPKEGHSLRHHARHVSREIAAQKHDRQQRPRK